MALSMTRVRHLEDALVADRVDLDPVDRGVAIAVRAIWLVERRLRWRAASSWAISRSTGLLDERLDLAAEAPQVVDLERGWTGA